MPQCNQSHYQPASPHLRGESKKKIGVPQRPTALVIRKFHRDPAPCPPPLPQRGCHVCWLSSSAGRGWGSGSTPGHEIREVTSLDKLAGGHLRPRTRPFCRGLPQATLSPLLELSAQRCCYAGPGLLILCNFRESFRSALCHPAL